MNSKKFETIKPDDLHGEWFMFTVQSIWVPVYVIKDKPYGPIVYVMDMPATKEIVWGRIADWPHPITGWRPIPALEALLYQDQIERIKVFHKQQVKVLKTMEV